MKRMLIAALLLTSSVPAFAQSYAELGFGATFAQSLSTPAYTVTSGANTATGKVDLDYDMGLAAGAEVGYAGIGLPELRLGLGYDFLESNFHAGKVTGTVNGTPGSFSFDRNLVNALGGSLDNDMNLVTGNAYYDLPAVGWLQPYVGVGLGGAFIDNADTSLALTASAGFRVTLNDSAYLGVRYRYYRIDGTTTNAGIKYDSFGTNSVMAIVGLKLD